MDPEVIQYIAANRKRYTREAIDAHLLNAGHTRANIDAAWSQVGGDARPSPSGGRAFWGPLIGAIVVLYGGTYFVYSASLSFDGEPGVDLDLSGIIRGILLIALLLAGLISLAFVRPSRSAGRGVIGGLLTALGIPFVFLVIVAGLCTVLTGAPFAG